MTAVREGIRRLGEPSAISWPVFWVTYVINVMISLISGFDAEATWPQRIVAATVGQVAMFTFLILVRFGVLRDSADVTRGVLTLISFVGAGAIRGVAVSLAFMAMGPSGAELLIPRLPAGIVFGLVVLIPAALVVVAQQSYRTTRAALIQRRATLESARAQIVGDLDERDTRVESQVEAAFIDAMRDDSPAEESAERLRAFTAEVVRPLSHQLAEAVPPWEYRKGTDAGGRITLRGLVDRVAQGSPFLPWPTALTVALLTSSWVIWEEGVAAAMVYLVSGVLIVVVGLSLANAVLCRTLPGRSLPVRVEMVIAGSLCAGLMLGIGAAVLASSTPWSRALWAASMVFYPVFAFVLAFVRATNIELRDSVAELLHVSDQLTWQVARLRQMQWAYQRRAARALHGPVQAMMEAAAHQLSAGGDQRAILAGLRDELGSVLDPEQQDSSPVPWTEALMRIEATWQGVCQVEISCGDTTADAIDRDSVGAEIVTEVISEAVSNAVRHGKARVVTVEMWIHDDLLHLKLSNDGQPPKGMTPGLGSRLLDDCTVTWSRTSREGVTTLIAELPTEVS